jgi:hypothetical protein
VTRYGECASGFHAHSFDYETVRARAAARRVGFFKKMVIADRLNVK